MMQQSSLKIAHSDSRVPTEASPTLLHDRQFMAHTEEARCAPCPLPCLSSSAFKKFSSLHDHSGWVYHSRAISDAHIQGLGVNRRIFFSGGVPHEHQAGPKPQTVNMAGR
jgi:hypothetical protein